MRWGMIVFSATLVSNDKSQDFQPQQKKELCVNDIRHRLNADAFENKIIES